MDEWLKIIDCAFKYIFYVVFVGGFYVRNKIVKE